MPWLSPFKFVGVSSKHLRVFLESLRKSSEIFGNFRKFSENVRERSSGLRDNFGNLRKSSENHQKRRYHYVYIIKRTLHVSSKIWILCYSWQEQYLTRSLRSLVRYCSCHSNIKFISSRHRVISSISLWPVKMLPALAAWPNSRGARVWVTLRRAINHTHTHTMVTVHERLLWDVPEIFRTEDGSQLISRK